MHRLKPVIPVLLTALAVSGCANYGLQQRQAELAPLIGHTEQDLVQRMGVPTRTYETGGTKYLAYNESRTEFEPGFGPYYAGGFYGRGLYGGFGGYYGGFPPEVIQRNCETTFEVAGGAVRSFALRGNSCGYGTL